MRGVVGILLRRFLLPERGNILSFALWLSVLGVALGIAQLMVVLSVMTGFQHFLQDHYTRITSEVVTIPRHNHATGMSVLKTLQQSEQLSAVSPFRLAQAMVLKNGVGGVTVEGIDLATTETVTPWQLIWLARPTAPPGDRLPWIWLGKQLAKKLQVQVGDTVDVMIPDGKSSPMMPFRVTALTHFGIYEHDLRYVRIDLREFEKIYGADGEPLYKANVNAGLTIEPVAEKLRELVGKVASVKLWSDIHQNVFKAVAHQKALLFLVLEIVVLLAAMNVVNLLMMSSQQRKRDVAILRAMGMKFREVFAFFVAQGAVVGGIGIFTGVGLGYVLCHLVERFQPAILSESVYNVTRLPIRIVGTDVALICACALVLCIVCSVLPAWRAALQRPVETLRNE